MPHIEYGSMNANNRLDFGRINYDYEYPDDQNFSPRDQLHNRICDSVVEKAYASHDVISERFSSWREVDKCLTGYIPADEEEKQATSNDPQKPNSIVFPYSYAVLDTLLTYLTTIFIQDPVFEYKGVSPEDTVGTALLEKIIQRHVKKNKVPLALHTMWRDSLAYGIGPVAPGWSVRWGRREKMRTSGRISSLGRLIGREPEETTKQQILFEGNELNNIDPYNVLPDPNVSIHNIQKGEFFGWIEETSVTQLLNQEVNDADFFNVRYLKHITSLKTALTLGSEPREKKVSNDPIPGQTTTCEVIHMYIDLIPSDWNLGDSEYPEKWLFSVAAGEVLIRAKSLGLSHGLYPITVAAPDFDGRSIAPFGKLETIYGLQHILNFLFNSHMTNVRKAINDMFVVDPYLINMNDLKDPQPGKLVRMRRPGWGKGVKDAVAQLNVADVTRQNIGDSSWVLNWMNNISGADESMMGSLRDSGPERLTATEFKGTRSSSMSRLGHMSSIISYQAMQDIGYFFAAHTQQLLSQESYVDMIGRWREVLMKEYGAKVGGQKMKVSPSDIQVDYDISIKDSSTGSGNNGDLWLQLFQLIAEHPELEKTLDITRIFRHVATEAGAQNVDSFFRDQGQNNPTSNPGAGVMSDSQIQQEVAKGNLVPQQK